MEYNKASQAKPANDCNDGSLDCNDVNDCKPENMSPSSPPEVNENLGVVSLP